MTNINEETLAELDSDWNNWRNINWTAKYRDSFVSAQEENNTKSQTIEQDTYNTNEKDYVINYTQVDDKNIVKTIYKKAVEDILLGIKDKIDLRFGN